MTTDKHRPSRRTSPKVNRQTKRICQRQGHRVIKGDAGQLYCTRCYAHLGKESE